MPYLLLIFSVILVACPAKPRDTAEPEPKATQEPASADVAVKQLVKFVNPPSDEIKVGTPVIVGVAALNGATEYTYILIQGTGNCESQKYPTWIAFSTSSSIELDADTLGDAGVKTLCAKGKKADGTKQQVPTRHDLTLVADPSTTGGGEGGGGGGEGGGAGDGAGGGAGGHSLDPDGDEEIETSRGLKLSTNLLKFASAAEELQLIRIENTGGSSLNWSVKTTDTAGWLEIRTIASENKEDEDNGQGWQEIKKKENDSEIVLQGTLSMGGTQYFQLKLADKYKTDYGSDSAIKINFNDGSEDVELTAHILVPKLIITADEDDDAIKRDADGRVWRVTLSLSAKQKTLTIANSKGDLDVLNWNVFPYAWHPNWFSYDEDKAEGTIKVMLKDNKCELYPKANEDDKLTLIIASNSDSKDMQARSFVLSDSQPKLEWKKEKEDGTIESKSKDTEWYTNDIRYVVVQFKNEDGATCP